MIIDNTDNHRSVIAVVVVVADVVVRTN